MVTKSVCLKQYLFQRSQPLMEHKTPSSSLFTLLVQLFWHIGRRRRYQFMLMLGLTLASSIAEVVSLGAVLPFIGSHSAGKSVQLSENGRRGSNAGNYRASRLVLPCHCLCVGSYDCFRIAPIDVMGQYSTRKCYWRRFQY